MTPPPITDMAKTMGQSKRKPMGHMSMKMHKPMHHKRQWLRLWLLRLTLLNSYSQSHPLTLPLARSNVFDTGS
jgi:hypothetical protein